jgi:hypothetical protein
MQIRPGDVHVYFYSASTLSCSDGVKPAVGDTFEVSSSLFGRPLRNSLVAGHNDRGIVHVEAL